MRKCKSCEKIYPENDTYFHKNPNTKCGKMYLTRTCKKCLNQKIYRKNKILRKIKYSNRWWSDKFHSIKGRAKKRGIEFNLILDDYKKIRTNWKCYYCGSKEKFSVERLDNKLGYFKNNIVACCTRCNYLKRNIYSCEEMLILGKAFKKINRLRKTKNGL